MKHSIPLTVLTVALLVTASLFLQCRSAQQNPPNAPTNTLQEITKRGEMRVGYLVFDPCVIKDPRTGELSGIYPDMINQIAKALNVKVSWNETTLANFTAGLESNQFDFSVGPTFITIPRSAAVSFTEPIAYVGNSGVVKTNGSFQPQRIEDLQKPQVRIAVLQGQALEEYVRRNIPNANLIVLSGGDLTAPLVAVSSGQADIGLMNSVTVAQYVSAHPEVTAVLTGTQQIENLPLSWATRHSDLSLLQFLNSSIVYLKATARLEEYQRKYPIKLLYDTPVLHSGK